MIKLLAVVFCLMMSACSEESSDDGTFLFVPTANMTQGTAAPSGSTSNTADESGQVLPGDTETHTSNGTASNEPVSTETEAPERTEPTSQTMPDPIEDDDANTNSDVDETTGNSDESTDTEIENTDTETETEPDSETAPDTDSTDAHTDSVSDADCTLILKAEVRDQSGPCLRCRSGDYITVVGVVENPCDTERTYTARRDCLVQEFDVLNLDYNSRAEYPMTCRPSGRTEVIAPGATITQTRPAGRLSSASYELEVLFGDNDNTVDTLSFSVQ